jgi:hypothetical protein
VKKLIVLILAAAAGYLAYRSWAGSQAENDIWAQATDPVERRDLR